MRSALSLRLMVVGVATVMLTAVAGVSAQPAVGPTLRASTDGHGTIASGDRRIACGSRCSARYRSGDVVSLRATPARFFLFDRWSGGCVGASPRCVLAVDASKTVRASFVRTKASLSLAVGGPGVIVSSPQGISCGKGEERCSADFPAGTSVTLTPIAASGGLFGLWTGPCAGAGESPCTFVVDGDMDFNAAFRHSDPDPDQALLTVIPEGASVRSTPPGIACPSTCQAEFPSGTVVTLSGFVREWNGACAGSLRSCVLILDRSDGVGTGGPPPLLPPPSRKFGINISVSGPGLVSGQGGIRCGRTTRSACENLFSAGASVVLRAKPGRRGRFLFWSGFCTGKKRTCFLRVTAPKTVQAVFRR